MKHQQPINAAGYYIGPEVQWNVEDVEMYAESMGMTLSDHDLRRILIAAFEDNEALMDSIAHHIKDALTHLIETNAITSNQQ